MLGKLKLIRMILLSDTMDIHFSKPELISLILKLGLESMEELKLACEILHSNTEKIPVSKEEFIRLSLELGLENLYVGERCNHASSGMVIRDMSGRRITPNMTGGKKSLFRHSSEDYYYYDILDQDTRCEKIHPDEDFFYVRYGCTNLVKAEEMLKEKGKVYQKEEKV